MTPARKRQMLAELELIETELHRRSKIQDPTNYGLPDLLFPQDEGETDEDYKIRQDAALVDCVEKHLKFKKSADFRQVLLIPPMLRFIADIFFRRSTFVIVWKPRGSGGSLGAGVLIWLMMVYRRQSCVNMAGCLLPGTPVWTGRGWVPVEDVEVGDVVHSREGIQKVYSVTSKPWEGGPTTMVKPHGYGPGWTLTSDHRVWAIRGVGKRNRRGPLLGVNEIAGITPEWVPCGELTPDDVLVIERPQRTGTTPKGVEVSLNRNGRGGTKVVEWSPELARFAGYWLAEGSTCRNPSQASDKEFKTVQFSVYTKDEWLDDLHTLSLSLFDRHAQYDEPHPGDTKEARVRFGHTRVAEWLEGTFGKGAHNKGIPTDLIDGLSDECLMQLLVGWLRGDGCAKLTSRGAFDVCGGTVSPALVASFYRIGLRLGLVPSYGVENRSPSGFAKNSSQMHTLRWGSKDADTLMERAFEWYPQKERKLRSRKVWVGQDRVYLGIRSVESSTWDGEVYDLGVESDPSFVVPSATLHNSGEQAQAVYDYIKGFWEYHAEFRRNLLANDPTAMMLKFINGVYFKCLTGSEKGARGKHPPFLMLDEACQRDDRSDMALNAAMQTVMSEPDPTVVLVSTFHHPTGLFQECILPGELVLTESGWRPVESVQAGDLVVNQSGEFVPTSKVWSKDLEGTKVTIHPRGFHSGFSVTGGHGVLTEEGWVAASDLSVGDYLRIPRPPRVPGPGRLEMKRHSLNQYGESWKDESVEFSPDLYRWLGYWFGDGSNNRRLISHSYGKYDDFGDDYDNLVSTLFDRKVTTCDEKNGVSEKSFGNKGLISWIENHCRSRDRKKTVPHWLISRASREEIEQFLVGIFRTDGHLRKSSMTVYTVSHGIAQAIYLSLLRLGIPPSVTPDKGADNGGWEINVSSELAIDLVEKCYGVRPDWGEARGVKVQDPCILVRIGKISHEDYSGPVWDMTVPDGESFSMICGTAHNTWDFHEAKGFDRYKWSIFETMEKCERGMDTATEEDPKALLHCQSCPLTRRVEVKDRRGYVIDYAYKGCNGTARDTDGFQSYEQVIKAKKLNMGTSVFENEYEGERPEFGANIYSMAKIQLALAGCPRDDQGFPYIDWEYETPKAIGLDWGMNETAIIVVSLEKEKGYAAIVDYMQLSGKLVPEIANHLERMHKEYSPEGASIPVYADSSHPYNNMELGNRGFDVQPVEFNKFKEFGIGNTGRFFNLERLRILPDFTALIRQLKAYRRGRDGKPVKKDDHGPDALMCALMHFQFTDVFSEDVFVAQGFDVKERTKEVLEF